MDTLNRCCAGLDVHQASISACARRLLPNDQVEQQIRKFGTTTAELLALLDWLVAFGVTVVAMESTGVYWKPVFNILEGHLRVVLVNAEYVKQVEGRKTDAGDCAWIAELLQHGLPRPSFVPKQPIRQLRDLTRQRVQLIGERTAAANRIQKVLEDGNVKLASVASDVLGVSGRAMLRRLIAGDSDPEQLADLARGVLRKKIPALREALRGQVNDHHRFLLRLHLDHLDHLEGLVERLSERVVELIGPEPDPESPEPQPGQAEPPSPSGERSQPTVPSQGGSQSPASQQTGPQEAVGQTLGEAARRLQTIPGISRRTAEVVLAEIGADMEQFPSAEHLASWAGVCPGNNESAGKRYSGKTRRGNRWLKQALVQAAWAVSRKKKGYLREYHRNLAQRRGRKRATLAVAHELLRCCYHVLKKGEAYKEPPGAAGPAPKRNPNTDAA